MRNPIFIFFLITVLILVDFYIYYVLRTVFQGFSINTKTLAGFIYWGLCTLSLGSFILFPYISNPYFKQYFFSIGVGWVLTQLFMIGFFIVDDVRRGAFWTMGQISSATGAKFMNTNNTIPRSTFLSWLGVGMSSTLFFSLLYGFGNKYNYKLLKKKVAIPNLPLAFKGFKIIHISDIHSGSLKEVEAVKKGVQILKNQQPDLV